MGGSRLHDVSAATCGKGSNVCTVRCYFDHEHQRELWQTQEIVTSEQSVAPSSATKRRHCRSRVAFPNTIWPANLAVLSSVLSGPSSFLDRHGTTKAGRIQYYTANLERDTTCASTTSSCLPLFSDNHHRPSRTRQYSLFSGYLSDDLSTTECGGDSPHSEVLVAVRIELPCIAPPPLALPRYHELYQDQHRTGFSAIDSIPAALILQLP